LFFGDSDVGPLVAHGRQRELNEHRVADDRFLAAGMVPAEREASRRIDRLHDDRPALVAEPIYPWAPGSTTRSTRSANHWVI
jgi:hypothetical protein